MEGKQQSPVFVMRVIKYSFVVAAFFFVYVAFKVLAPPPRPVSQTLQMAIAFVGITSVIAGFFVPRLLLRAAEGAAQNVPAQTRLQRWFTSCIVSLAFFEACVLFGVVLHQLGGRASLVGLLFGVGIAAELFLTPGEPRGTDDGRSFQS